jgi:hypothetical protein
MGFPLGKILKGVVKTSGRLLDQVFTGGIIHNTLEETKLVTSNEKVLDQSEKGKIDFPKWFAMLLMTLPIWLIIALKLGWLTMEEVQFIFKSLDK